MKERKSADITIYSHTGEALQTVPITAGSKRVCKLMGDDYISLAFTLDEAVHFPIGSYINDEVFGKFVITQEQMPKDEHSTGGYAYELRFDAWYKVWNNKHHMMTSSRIKDNVYYRKETTWSLTSNLRGQVAEVVRNLAALGYADIQKTKERWEWITHTLPADEMAKNYLVFYRNEQDGMVHILSRYPISGTSEEIEMQFEFADAEQTVEVAVIRKGETESTYHSKKSEGKATVCISMDFYTPYYSGSGILDADFNFQGVTYLCKSTIYETKEEAQQIISGTWRTYECVQKAEYYTDEEIVARYCTIHDSATQAMQAETMTFSGTGIIDALKNIADTWNCEYWITGTEGDFILHFGKCEHGDLMPISTTDEDGQAINAESMTINRDQQTYANKVYAYGSTDNIPFTYRKKCQLTIKEMWYHQKGWGTRYAMNFVEGDFTSQNFPREKNLDHRVMALPFIGVFPIPDGIAKTVMWDTEENYGSLTSRAYMTHSISGIKFPEIGLLVSVPEGKNPPENVTMQYLITERYEWEGGEPVTNTRLDKRIFAPVESTIVDESSAKKLYKVKIPSQTFDEILLPESGTEAGENFLKVSVLLFVDRGVDFDVESSSEVLNLNDESGIRVLREYTKQNMSRDLPCTYTKNGIEYKKKIIWNYGMHTDVERFPNNYPICKTAYLMNMDGSNPSTDEIPEPGTTLVFDAEYDYGMPSSLFVSEYDNPSAIARIGERRLQMPIGGADGADYGYPALVCTPDGYIIPKALQDAPNAVNVVETAVAFEKVYPKGMLLIDTVTTQDRVQKDEVTGEPTKLTWDWKQYHLTLKTVTGDAFPFDKSYILQGYMLGIRFLTPHDVKDYISEDTLKDQCKLAGMQFECEFNRSALYKESGSETNVAHPQDYAIVRNEDFGTKLPAEPLVPTAGDPVCLINWDVKALMKLGLIDRAEKELLQKAFEYTDALQEGNFTFECPMMSDWMFNMYGEYVRLQVLSERDQEKRTRLLTASAEELQDSNKRALLVEDTIENRHNKPTRDLLTVSNTPLLVRNDYDAYLIPSIGQRVRIHHNALNNGVKETRIIGYEYKLDKPYDTPKITCGETEAYSRLKQIEKEITKLS